jgi:hypothetical protein
MPPSAGGSDVAEVESPVVETWLGDRFGCWLLRSCNSIALVSCTCVMSACLWIVHENADVFMFRKDMMHEACLISRWVSGSQAQQPRSASLPCRIFLALAILLQTYYGHVLTMFGHCGDAALLLNL